MSNPEKLSDERLAQMVDSARRIEAWDWVSAFAELQSLRAAPTPDAHSEVGVKAWLVRRYSNDGWPMRDEVFLEKPDIRSTSRTDFIPLGILTAGVEKAEPVAITDEMVKSGLSAWWAAEPGPTDTSYREAMRAALYATLASKPEGEL